MRPALVALGAAYASYHHGREFAARFGADEATAAIWPLIVDGLLTTATVELWKNGNGRRAGGRWAAWLAFVFGICLSLCANVAAAPELSVFAVAVAARSRGRSERRPVRPRFSVRQGDCCCLVDLLVSLGRVNRSLEVTE